MSQFDEFENPLNEEASEPQSMSLMGGIAGGGALPGPEGFGIDGSNESKRITQQSFLIGLIVTVVAFGVLAGLRFTQKSADASSLSPEAEKFYTEVGARIENLDKLDPNDPLHPDQMKDLFKTTADIVAAIENDPTQKQVPIDQVQMNPFTPVYVKPVAKVDTGAGAEAERKAKLTRLYSELASVNVQSLVGGDRPRAFINGDLLKVGDTIGSFRIVSIDNRKVVFEAPGFELRPDETAFALGMSRGR